MHQSHSAGDPPWSNPDFHWESEESTESVSSTQQRLIDEELYEVFFPNNYSSRGIEESSEEELTEEEEELLYEEELYLYEDILPVRYYLEDESPTESDYLDEESPSVDEYFSSHTDSHTDSRTDSHTDSRTDSLSDSHSNLGHPSLSIDSLLPNTSQDLSSNYQESLSDLVSYPYSFLLEPHDDSEVFNSPEEESLFLIGNVFPQVTPSLIEATAHLAYSTYVGAIVLQTDVLERIRALSSMELEYLKMRVCGMLVEDIPDPLLVWGLVEFISRGGRSLTSTRFRDLLNVDRSSCGICYEEFKGRHKCTSLQCFHTFHTRCITKWVKMSWCCPLCRSKDI